MMWTILGVVVALAGGLGCAYHLPSVHGPKLHADRSAYGVQNCAGG